MTMTIGNELNHPNPPPAMTPGIQVVHQTEKFVFTDSLIGRGSTGVVTWGCSIEGSPVVRKIVFDDKESAVSEKAALQRNIPHTPRFRDYFENEGHNIVMDQVQGHTLDKHIECLYTPNNRVKRLTLIEIRSIAAQALEFIAYLAERGQIHGDLSCVNMMWKRESHCLMIIDLASIRDEKSEQMKWCAYEYESFESLMDKKVPPSDVWSIACILYEIIVCQYLFYRYDGWDEDKTEEECMVEQIKKLLDTPVDKRDSEHWTSRVSESLKTLGATKDERQEWIKLLSSMLCYKKDRADAKDLLKSPLFSGEIHVNLIHDPNIRCTMQLQRAAAKVADLTLEFKWDRNTCLHIPKDPNDTYVLSLDNYTNKTQVSLQLKNGDDLDITKHQAQLNPVESSSKRAKKSLFQDQ